MLCTVAHKWKRSSSVVLTRTKVHYAVSKTIQHKKHLTCHLSFNITKTVSSYSHRLASPNSWCGNFYSLKNDKMQMFNCHWAICFFSRLQNIINSDRKHLLTLEYYSLTCYHHRITTETACPPKYTSTYKSLPCHHVPLIRRPIKRKSWHSRIFTPYMQLQNRNR